MKRGRPTMLYVIESEINFVKIGIADNPDGRLQQFQDASPFILRLLHTEISTVEYEKRLHSGLNQFRANGEWYYGSKAFKEVVSGVLGPIPWLPDLTPASVLNWGEDGIPTEVRHGRKKTVRRTLADGTVKTYSYNGPAIRYPAAMQALRMAAFDGLENLILNSPDRVKLRKEVGEKVLLNLARLRALRADLQEKVGRRGKALASAPTP